MPERWLRLPQVRDLTAMSKSEIYRRIQEGTFPKQLRLSHRKAVWRESDIASWQERTAAGV